MERPTIPTSCDESLRTAGFPRGMGTRTEEGRRRRRVDCKWECVGVESRDGAIGGEQLNQLPS